MKNLLLIGLFAFGLGACSNEETPGPADMGSNADMATGDLGVLVDANLPIDSSSPIDSSLPIDGGADDASVLVDATIADASTDAPLVPTAMVDCEGATIAQTVHGSVSEGYVASEITISSGDIVQWINDDEAIPHTVWGSDAAETDFFAYNLDAGGSLCVQFFALTDYEYYCYFHPSMTGTVHVR